MEPKIHLCEPLHSVYQGEGPNINHKMVLMRVHGCPIQCPDCDSKQSWSKEYKFTPYSFTPSQLHKEIALMAEPFQITNLMISGGEPSLYQRQLLDLISLFPSNWKFEIETSGNECWDTFSEYFDRIQFNFSPKIGSLSPDHDIEWKAFKCQLPPNYAIKVVIDQESFDQSMVSLTNFMFYYGLSPNQVTLMPAGTTREEIIANSQFLMPICMYMGFKFTTRLHILIYDNKKLV